MSNPSTKPRFADKFLGYSFTLLTNFINGFDAGAGVVKLPLWIASITVTAIYAPWVLTGGFSFGAIFMAKSIYEEYANNKKESDRIGKKRLLVQQSRLIDQELATQLRAEMKEKEPVRMLSLEAFFHNKTKKEVDSLVDQKVDQHLIEDYPDIFTEGDPSKKNNHHLLRIVLRDYFQSFGSNPQVYRKANGHYPGDGKIFKLIQAVTGLHPNANNFHAKVSQYLQDDPTCQAAYRKFFPSDLKPEKQTVKTYIANKIDSLKVFFKRQKTLRHFARGALNSLGDFGAGAGISTSLLRMFGVIAMAGGPVSWPIIAVVAASAVLFAGISFAYRHGRGLERKRNIRSLDHEIEKLETRLELTKRLRKIHKHSASLKKHYGSYDVKNAVVEDITPVKVEYPLSLKLRIAMGIAGKIITAAATATAVAMGIAWVGSILFPFLPFVSPSLYGGAALSGFFIYNSVKSEVAAAKKELALIKEVAELKQAMQGKYGHDQRVRNDQQKDNITLLKEVMLDYVKFIDSLGGPAKATRNSHGKYPKQEKIFKLIETLTGASRGYDESDNPKPKGDDLFYDQVAKHLKGESQSSDAANQVVQQFKNLFVPRAAVKGFTNRPVNGNNPELYPKMGKLETFVTFFGEHILPVVGAVGLAVGLPLFLAGGPVVAIVAPVAALILGGFLLAKVASHYSKKNVAALENEKNQCKLIDRKYKLDKLMPKEPARGEVMDVRPTVVNQDRPSVRVEVSPADHVPLTVHPNYAPEKLWEGPLQKPTVSADKLARSLNYITNPRPPVKSSYAENEGAPEMLRQQLLDTPT